MKKKYTGLIDGTQGFARCAQILLATKIGGATAVQNLWVKWTVGSWGPVGTSIVLVLVSNKKSNKYKEPYIGPYTII